MLFKETGPIYSEYREEIRAKYIDRKGAFLCFFYVEVAHMYSIVTFESERNKSSCVVKE